MSRSPNWRGCGTIPPPKGCAWGDTRPVLRAPPAAASTARHAPPGAELSRRCRGPRRAVRARPPRAAPGTFGDAPLRPRSGATHVPSVNTATRRRQWMGLNSIRRCEGLTHAMLSKSSRTQRHRSDPADTQRAGWAWRGAGETANRYKVSLGG